MSIDTKLTLQVNKGPVPGEVRQVQQFDIRLSILSEATIDILFSKVCIEKTLTELSEEDWLDRDFISLFSKPCIVYEGET